MFAEVDKGLKELRAWLKAHGVADEGPFLLRCHVIDMAGMMDVEVAFVVREALEGDDRVRPGVLPSGRYASLTVVHAEQDESIRAEHAAYQADALPDAELVHLDDVSHFAPVQRPELIDRTLAAFLGRDR